MPVRGQVCCEGNGCSSFGLGFADWVIVSFGPFANLIPVYDARRRIACDCLGLIREVQNGRLLVSFAHPVRKIHSVVIEQHTRLVGQFSKFLVLLDTWVTSGMSARSSRPLATVTKVRSTHV